MEKEDGMRTTLSGNSIVRAGIAFSLIFAVFTATYPIRAAAYDIDCKVILCLAGGFPSGCGDAQSYMVKRLKRAKPPFGFCAFGSGGGEGVDYDLDMGSETWTECPGGYRTSWEREVGMVTRCEGGLHDCSQGYIRITIPEDGGGTFDSGRQRWGTPWCQPQDRGR